MDTSFYTGIRGAKTQQEKMNVISNNIANVNTSGFKSKDSVFQDLMYYNMRDAQGKNVHLAAGAGALQSHVNTNFSGAGLQVTGNGTDYAIVGEGFFCLQEPTTGEITYTRNGKFSLSQRSDGFYLVSDSGKLVLGSNRQPITVNNGETSSEPGAFTFQNTDGMESIGNNEFRAIDKNGEPILSVEAKIEKGYLELSNVNLAKEMADTIEASRAYSYVLKMVQTADEVEQTINGLRG
ncbi:flagellar basal-body rod protein FlgG [Aequitasia blattaphilus]|uniref:Flagellar hook-basal body protein n=1 Tax=Aequitasia blattaphilus TaxID=2949332 RepID=A0ABT1E9L6_9FIRM|nr:flagellar hook-basal body protein [Aequitasia blattaphilus]MCP1102526.1 flagellar hook-basal body protein [Aequitasia blattaphilus]MCR8615166.1 flagellar hook-basal body protein [Aequitasia blattaphilus]